MAAQNMAPGQGNTIPVKDGEATKKWNFPKELETTLPASSFGRVSGSDVASTVAKKLDDGWPESEKRVFQAALSMVVVKNSR